MALMAEIEAPSHHTQPLHDLKPDTSQPITVLRSSFGSVVFSTTISTDFHQIPPSDPLFQTSDDVLISPNAAINLHRSEARYILILGFFFGGISKFCPNGELFFCGLLKDLQTAELQLREPIFKLVLDKVADYESVGSVLHIRGKNILENEHVKIGAL
nr:isoform 2 of protein pelota 1 [Quercus suber]